MPGKLVKLPNKKGRYYRRANGKITYRGKKYTRYSPALDHKRKATKKPRRRQPHTGDSRKDPFWL